MEHEFAADSEGEESLDSIPRPEYEAIEMGAASMQSSPAVADPLSPIPKELHVSRNDEDMLDVQSEDAFSEKAALSAQDLHDLDITDEKLKQDPGKRVENDEFKDNKYKNTCAKILPPPTHSAATDLTRTGLTAAEEELVKHNPQTFETTSHKLMQAKTKDNKYLLVQLIDENGKTLRPPVRNINKSDIQAVPIARAPLGSVSADVATNTAQQIRSSTPISREFLALQKSVNESKILTEFVTDIAVEKARKRKPTTPAKDNNSTKYERQTSLDVGSSKVRRKSNTSEKLNTSAEHVTADSLLQMAGNNVKPENSNDTISDKAKQTTETQKAAMNCPVPMAATVQKHVTEKSRKSASSKFVPLKDESSSYQSDAGSSSSVKRRSRSKSVSRKSPAVADFDNMPGKLKRWPSDEKSLKRTNMRSQNSEFVQKQMDFLHRVIRQEDENNDEEEDDENDDGMLSMEEQQLNANNATADGDDAESQLATAIDNSINESSTFAGNFVGNTSDNSTPQAQVSNGSHTKTLEKYLESIYEAPPKRGCDSFCWKCRQSVDLLACSKCVRCFHATCIKITSATKLDKTWTCPECVAVEHVLNGPKRTRRNELSLDLLSQLLSFALKRMRNVKGFPQFLQSSNNFAKLSKYFVNPVTFNSLQEKIEKKVFRCAEEFVNEAKWMQHNTLIAAAGTNSKDSITAKAILKICRQEANEIDTCPECYLNANTRTDWFVDVCSQPHLLLWAKLKGFPYWPAKAMGLGQGAHVNVRFFGQHDRAFVPIKDCYLFSEQVPNALTGKRSARAGFAECIQEVEVHIEKIKSKVGAFNYAPYKTLYDPTAEMQQLELLMPGVQEFIKRQQSVVPQKPPLQYKIVKTADNHLSIVKKGTSTADSGTESDHSFGVTTGTAVTATINSSPGKKKSPDRTEATAEHNKPAKIATTSNYEVIHKISNEESNSSKVSAVILKRKAEHAEHRTLVDGGADSDLPLPKMTKIEENNEEELQPRNVIEKCRLNEESATASKESSSENMTSKVIQKHSKTEPKVPILTIKTNVNKVVETNQTNEIKVGTVEGLETINETPKVQSTVENLVKYKQGVTIKKLTKEDVRKKQACGNNHTEKQAIATKQTATSESADTTKASLVEKPQNDSNKCNIPLIPPQPQPQPTPTPPPVEPQQQQQQSPPVIKDLVPFVEIKKEVSSDDEETVVENVKSVTVIAAAATSSVSDAPAVPAINKPTFIAANTVETSVLPIAAPLPEVVPTLAAPLIGSVKKEILSDDDEVIAVPSTSDAHKISLIPVEKPVDAVPTVVVAQLAAPAETVRVVGDTTIQRVSTKACTSTTSVNQTQTTALQFQASTSNAATSTLPMTGSIYTGLSSHTTTTNLINASKRNAMRGIPYGPLPASATGTPAVRTLNNSENEKQPLHKVRPDIQRARKSFPNRSPTEVSPVRCGGVTPPTLPAVAVVNITDHKRSLTKTSMVSIPVDVATSRCNSAAVIPVPPLTAVTKVIPTTTSTAVSLPTASSSAVSTSVTTFLNCNGSTQITMSAPPPLAGLSYSTLSSTPSTVTLTSTPNVQLLNGSLDSSAGNSHSHNADTHGMGDFVTPTLASAITDAFCRGPPRMTPRPNGPLQSDGSTMFPSQAGPVCRTLVENAHKLTDFFISVMEDTMCEMSVGDESVLQAKITLLTMELERTKQTYESEIAELKRTSDVMLCEMRKSMETEKARIAADVRKQCELERKRSVEETKKKQWCANCGRESQFHCCWNTSYCDYPCQQLHWSRHAASCAQTRPSSNETSLQSVGVNTSTQMERHHANSKSSFTTISTNSTAHFNNKSGMNNKKDKTLSKVSTSTISNAMSTALAPTEVLKLPSNTYLRPVTSTANVRTPFPPQTPVQRFNIPLPIAAPANPGLPYTLVQREGNWELMSALTPTVAATNTSSVNTITINTSQQQQTRLGTTSATMSTKITARSRLNTSAVTMQSHSSNMTGSLQSSGALRSTQM